MYTLICYRSRKKTGGFYSYVFGFCAVSSIGITIVLAGKIFGIVYLWEMKAVTETTNILTQLILLFFAFLSTLLTYFGVFRIVTDIANSSTLLTGL